MTLVRCTLFRNEPLQEKFPSLYLATRSRATRKEVEDAISSGSPPAIENE